jgi:hypothetical protein
MNIDFSPMDGMKPSFSTPSPKLAASQRSFQQIMSIDRRGQGADVTVDKEREAAEQLIAVTFVEPILRQAREVRSSEGPFGMTQAEKQFGALLDAATARKMVQSWNVPMVDRLARSMREATG